jgi:hypothetical protein
MAIRHDHHHDSKFCLSSCNAATTWVFCRSEARQESTSKPKSQLVVFFGKLLGRNRIQLIELVAPVIFGVQDMLDKNRIHGEEVIRISTDAGAIDITLQKAEKTEAKLQKMRDDYVGDEWDNPTELLEWGGFFEGAAIVHFALVRGIAESLNDEGFLMLAQEGVNYHYEILDLIESELGSLGQNRATL